MEKVLQRFSMQNARTISYLLGGQFRLSLDQSPSSDEKDDMRKVSYTSVVGSLIYAMVYT